MTKSEMEDIWYNKPYGHFDYIKKTLKKSKMYKVHLTPITYVEGEPDAFYVRATSRDLAIGLAKVEYREKHKSNIADTWRTNVYES